MSYPQFNRLRLQLKPLAERQHDLTLDQFAQLDAPVPAYDRPDIPTLAKRMVAAARAGRAVVWMMGAHVIKNGLSRYVIDLMERGMVSLIAFNGACAIHDFELAHHRRDNRERGALYPRGAVRPVERDRPPQRPGAGGTEPRAGPG